MEGKEILKKMIIILAVIVIIIIVVLFLISGNKGNEKQLEKATHNQVDPVINEKNENKEETSPTRFYTVEIALKRYLECVKLDYEKHLSEEEVETGESTKANIYDISSEEEKTEKILKLLDTDFIKENNITRNNLNKYVNMDTDEIVSVRTMQMKVLEKEQFKTYSVKIQYVTESGKKDVEYFVVTLDEFNSTYMVKPVNNVENIDEIKLDAKKSYSKIENNDNFNKYSYARVDDAEMTAKYFRQYQNSLINDTEEAYNILEKEYKEKRFGNYETFKHYVEKNIQELSKAHIEQYLVNKSNDSKEYVCKDQNENIYIFKATSVANYAVQLDTYTIDSDEFKETYDSANDQNKVAMNISKWESMINKRDYQSAYNVLDETFRNNNFGSVENFEDYMRTMYPKYYNINIKDVKKESNAYVADVEIQEKDFNTVTGAGTYENKIILQLKDNRDFVMSFYVRRH